LAFAAGLVAAVNPCGFAMLPAYLVLVVRAERADEPGVAAVGRALMATAGMGLGFFTVFGLFGALTISAGATVQRYLPYAVVVIGIVLVALGIWLLLGRELTLLIPRYSGGRWAPTARLGSMYGYGVSYAIASLSCTVGPFLAVTAAGLRSGSMIGSASVYLAYIAGLTLVVGVLAVAAAVANSAVVSRLRRILPYVNRISGALLVLVGLYVGYYAVYEIRLRDAKGPAVDTFLAGAGRVQGALAGWVHQHGAWPWLLALAVVLAGVLVGALYRRVRPTALPEPAASASPPVAHGEEQHHCREADQIPVLDATDMVAVQHRQQQAGQA
jgi:cytochrome c biogenesis protein CcdA